MANNGQKLLSGLLALLAVLSVIQISREIPFIIARLHYPFELDYGEGPLLYQIANIKKGLSIYPPWTTAPFTVSNYPLVYHYAVWLLSSLLGIDLLFAGRAISIICAFCTAIIIGMTVDHITHKNLPRRLSFLTASVAGLLFFCNWFVVYWDILMRVDMLALFWEMTGLYFFIVHKGYKRIIFSAPFFLLAIYTKQIFISAAIACCIVTLLHHRRSGICFALSIAVPAFFILAWATYVTDGQFLAHIAIANQNAYDLSYALLEITLLFLMYGFVIITSFMESVSIIRRPKEESAVILAVFWMLALFIMLSIGKRGANVNYFMEFTAINCTLFGIALHRALSSPKTAQNFLQYVMCFALLQSITLTFITYFDSGVYAYFKHPEQNEKETQQVLDYVKSIPGIVISADMVLLYRSGKELYFQPFEMSQLAIQKAWDPSAFLDSLREKRIAAIIFTDNIAFYDTLSPEVLYMPIRNAIKKNYILKFHTSGYYVYEPIRH